jgi:hypothetical protein
MYLTKKTIYLLLIIFLIMIYIKNRNCIYGYNNIEPYINLDKKSDVGKEYVNIITENTEILKEKLNRLNQYYVYKLLELIFLKKTEKIILSTFVKNKTKCDVKCMEQTNHNISLLNTQINNLNNMISKFEIKDKDNFIKKQLQCITKNSRKTQNNCLGILQGNYYNDNKSDDDIKNECIKKYKIDAKLCRRPATEISFIMSKNKCVESRKVNTTDCIKIPEEIEFMTHPNISKYIKDIEKQIKKQEPKLNRFLCYKCINRFDDAKNKLEYTSKDECKEVCKEIVEEIQNKKKIDYMTQQRLFLKQQQQMNEYYEKQYKQSDGVTSQTLQKIFNGEEAISDDNYSKYDITDIYKYIDVTKHKISEIEFNRLYNKVNSKLNQHVKLNKDDFNDMYILFNNNYTNNYYDELLVILQLLNSIRNLNNNISLTSRKNLNNNTLLNILKNNIKTINEEEKEYETASNENRDILSHSGYDKQLLSSTTDKKHFTIPNLPEFYDLSKIQKDLTVNYRDLQGSPLPMTNNIYDSKFKSVSIN